MREMSCFKKGIRYRKHRAELVTHTYCTVDGEIIVVKMAVYKTTGPSGPLGVPLEVNR